MNVKSKLWPLVKIQLLSFFSMNRLFSRLKGGGAGKIGRTGIGAFIVAAFTCYFIWVSYIYSDGMANAMLAYGGRLDIVPAMMMAGASLMALITGIYSGGRVLFKYNDFDIVMSLPVSTATIAASRVIVLYVYDLMFTVILLSPAAVVYAKYAEVSPAFWPVYALCMLAVPLIPLIISAAIGTLVTVASSRMRRLTNLVNILLSLAFVAAIVFISMRMNRPEAMALGLESLYGSVISRWPPAEMFTRAVCDLSLLNIFSFLILSIGIFAAFCLLISLRYKRICSAVASAGAASPHRGARTRAKASAPLFALYAKELRRYFASPIYVMNTMVGLIMAIGACAMLLVGDLSVFGVTADAESIRSFKLLAAVAAPPALSALVSMSCTTGCSISLEGKRLWIIASIPAGAGRILLSKALVNLTLTVPTALICAALLTPALELRGLALLFIFTVPIVYAVFSAAFGLIVNLYLPRLDWTSETQIVKRSLSSMISMFGSALAPVLVTVAVVSSGAGTIIIAVSSVIVLAAAVALTLYLRSKGESMLKALWE